MHRSAFVAIMLQSGVPRNLTGVHCIYHAPHRCADDEERQDDAVDHEALAVVDLVSFGKRRSEIPEQSARRGAVRTSSSFFLSSTDAMIIS